jgi:hypothetical protein
MPYYQLRHGKLIRRGLFSNDRTMINKIYRIMYKSNIIKFFEFYPITNNDIKLTYSIIEESKNIYNDNFNGKFYVLVHPLSNMQDRLKKELEENNISLLQPPKIYGNNYTLHESDGHPNALTNEILAEYILKKI